MSDTQTSVDLFPEIFQPISSIATQALAFSQLSLPRENRISEEEMVAMLSLFECFLDRARAVIPVGSRVLHDAEIRDLESKLGQLRAITGQKRNSCDKEVLNDTLRQFSEHVATRFSKHD